LSESTRGSEQTEELSSEYWPRGLLPGATGQREEVSTAGQGHEGTSRYGIEGVPQPRSETTLPCLHCLHCLPCLPLALDQGAQQQTVADRRQARAISQSRVEGYVHGNEVEFPFPRSSRDAGILVSPLCRRSGLRWAASLSRLTGPIPASHDRSLRSTLKVRGPDPRPRHRNAKSTVCGDGLLLPSSVARPAGEWVPLRLNTNANPTFWPLGQAGPCSQAVLPHTARSRRSS